MSGLQRPPRLPLAIADELRAPESPPLGPTETLNEEVSIFEEDEADLPRKSSMLSSATADEDDVAHELEPYAVDTGGVSPVRTRIDWKGGGERVYVTGTFTNWDKKFRLHERYGLVPVLPCSQRFALCKEAMPSVPHARTRPGFIQPVICRCLKDQYPFSGES